MTEKLVLSVTEAAEALGISRRSMYELLNQADFPASLRIGGRRLISRELLAEWVRNQAKKEAAQRAGNTQDGMAEQVLQYAVSASHHIKI